MLVLTRRLGEEILIDGQIRIEVVALKNGHVRLGITAPPVVTVLRTELCEAPEEGAETKKPVQSTARPRRRRAPATLA